jgi:hypothetical protein
MKFVTPSQFPDPDVAARRLVDRQRSSPVSLNVFVSGCGLTWPTYVWHAKMLCTLNYIRSKNRGGDRSPISIWNL